MALSDYASVGFDNEGNFTDSFTEGDLSVDLYKNWTYLRCPAMAAASVNSHGYSPPTFAEFQEGRIVIGKVHLIGKLIEEQRAHFVIAKTGYREDARWFAGVACSGYIYPNGYDGEAEWVGVTPKIFDEFVAWAVAELKFLGYGNDTAIEAWSAKIKEGAKSFNQGDAFFAENLGFETPTSPIGGEQQTPIIMQMLKK